MEENNIKLKSGDVIELGGEPYECVKGSFIFSCDDCDLLDTEECDDVDCGLLMVFKRIKKGIER